MEALAVLIAALLHATWNGMLKHSSNQTRSLIINRSVAASIGLLFVLFLPTLNAQAWPYLIAASIIHLIYFFSLLGAYRHGDFSQVYPISRGLAPVLILVTSVLLGIDEMTMPQMIGVLVVSFGILLLAGNNALANKKPLSYALLTALCIAGYSIASGIGVRNAQHFLIYVAYLEFISGALFVFVALLSQHKTLNWSTVTFSSTKKDMLAGILAITGFGVALWAMSRISIATVSALRETSVIFAVLIAWLVLKEPQAKQRVIASVVVTIGITVIFLTY